MEEDVYLIWVSNPFKGTYSPQITYTPKGKLPFIEGGLKVHATKNKLTPEEVKLGLFAVAEKYKAPEYVSE